MKNIHKLAEEIFKAPSKNEINKRWKEARTFLTHNQIAEELKRFSANNNKIAELANLFPNGAIWGFREDDKVDMIFKEDYDFIMQNAKRWELVNYRSGEEWKKTELYNGKNAVIFSYNDHDNFEDEFGGIVAYIFEK